MIGQVTSYFNVTDRDRQWGFQVTGAGHATIEPGRPYPPQPHPAKYHFTWERGRRLEEFALIYLVAGRGTFESKHQPPTGLEAGQAALLFPGEWHRYHPDPVTGWEEYWVTFGGTIVEAWQRKRFLRADRPLIRENLGLSLAPTFDELLRLTSRRTPHDTFTLTGLCHLLIGRVLSAAHTPQRDERAEAILQAADYLRLHAGEPVDLQKLARKLGMSYSAFRHSFLRDLGAPPHRFHQEARLALVKELLASTDLPLKCVAEQLHYPTEFYLMQSFKRQTGLTPTQWRRRGKSTKAL